MAPIPKLSVVDSLVNGPAGARQNTRLALSMTAKPDLLGMRLPDMGGMPSLKTYGVPDAPEVPEVVSGGPSALAPTSPSLGGAPAAPMAPDAPTPFAAAPHAGQQLAVVEQGAVAKDAVTAIHAEAAQPAPSISAPAGGASSGPAGAPGGPAGAPAQKRLASTPGLGPAKTESGAVILLLLVVLYFSFE